MADLWITDRFAVENDKHLTNPNLKPRQSNERSDNQAECDFSHLVLTLSNCIRLCVRVWMCMHQGEYAVSSS